ncbi:neurotrypsin [Acomys russatus]|uniref:neurotrypsin n=1 Tax=Acomys russatus TaxID=60746 RepID=UPI0021E2A2FF|nr:neurotrypsin [Acomys russatus]
MALALCVLAVILGALPALASFDPASRSPLPRTHPSPLHPQHAHHLPTSLRPPRTPRFPLRTRDFTAQSPQVLIVRHTPPTLPRRCGAGEPWGNATDLGVPCLHWDKVPPFLERSPPASWAELRGKPHNFCRVPEGAGRPWCFYRNAQGKVDWGYCGCSQGPVLPVIRLAGGNSGHEGRVELYHAGQWGTICDDQWDDADAEVICRQLGLSGIAKAWHQAHFGEGSGPVLLDEVRCTGNELSIEQCPKSSWGEHNCGHKEDAGVSCVPLTDGVIRLAGGKSGHEGRLEVYYRGQWGTVCDDGWTEMNTYVACRLLGFKYGKQSSVNHFEGSNRPIWLDDVSCSGKEVSFIQCSRRQWGRHDCSHREDVGLICYPDSNGHRLSSGFPIRLMDGENKKEGRVEVFVNGQWGTICDDGWTDKHAAVICRQLGYKGPARARTMAYFGEGKGPIHMDNVKCTGNEKTLADCVKQDIGRHNCRHSEDAGVICDYFEKKASISGKTEMLSSGCGVRQLHRRQKRIIGGNNSLRGAWPWQASLRLRSSHGDGRLLCGATLLSSCWVLTAAHCFKRYGNHSRSYAVRVGDYHTLVPEEYEEEIGVQQIVIHRNYRPDSSDYDIALVKLQGPAEQCVRLNSHVLPACLPLWRERPQKTASNCHITGWGDTGRAYSRTLQQAPVPLLPKRFCKERYKGLFTGRMLCAGNLQEDKRVDSCQGDSGGPLMCQRPDETWVVYGVTSWGYGCGIKDTPGVYTRVPAFVPWIKSVTRL